MIFHRGYDHRPAPVQCGTGIRFVSLSHEELVGTRMGEQHESCPIAFVRCHRPTVTNPPRVDRLGNVLDLTVPEILELDGHAFANSRTHCLRDTDSTRLRQSLETRCDIDSVTIDVTAIVDHLAQIDADSKTQALILGDLGVSLLQASLDQYGASQCIGDGGKIREHRVACVVNDSTPQCAHHRGDGVERARESAVRTLFILGCEAAVSGNVGIQDRRQLSGKRCIRRHSNYPHVEENMKLGGGCQSSDRGWNSQACFSHSCPLNGLTDRFLIVAGSRHLTLTLYP